MSKNVLSNWLAHGVRLVIGLAVAPFLVHRLGNAEYGIWVLVFTLTGYMGVLDLGIRPAVVRFVSKYKALDDHQNVNAVVNTSLAVFCFVAVLVVAAAFVLAPYMERFFQIEPGLESKARMLTIIIGLNVALSFPFGVIGAVLGGGLQRFDISNGIQILILMVRTAAIVLAVKAGHGIVAMGVIVLVASVVGYSLRYLAIRRQFPQFRLNLRLASRATLRTIFNYSLFAFLMAIASQMTYRSSSVILGAFLSVGAVTLFWIPWGLIEAARELVHLFTIVLIPRVSELEARKDTAGIYDVLVRGTRFVMLISLPAGIMFIGRGRNFIELWMGPEYAETALLLTIMAIPQFVAMPQRVASSILFGIGKHKWLCVVALVESLVNVLLSIFLVKRYGLIGAAVGLSIPVLVSNSLFHPIYTCRVIRYPLTRYLWKGMLGPSLSVIPAVIYLLLSRGVRHSNWFTFAAEGALIGVLFLVPAWWLVLWDEVRGSCLQTLRSLRSVLFGPSSTEPSE
jgi:O-antigen/teichoic acid export membrane protein